MAYASKEWVENFLGQVLKAAKERGLIGGEGGGAASDTTPVGTVISFMGKNAPTKYLICDGSIYNIADYPDLSFHINKEFGSYNFFGGDGVTTFAVPDLRGEFLRGSGTNSHTTEGDGAAVGVHQAATQIPCNYGNYNSSTSKYTFGIRYNSTNGTGTVNDVSYADKPITASKINYATPLAANIANGTSTASSYKFTARPTNTAVLYCIKYL